MPVSDAYREFVLEQLGRVVPVTSRRMFGGVGIYADGLFFALMDDDALFLKVDDSNRADFVAAGMPQFQPFGPDSEPLRYFQLPEELLEDPERMRPWIEGAMAVARAARASKAKKKKS